MLNSAMLKVESVALVEVVEAELVDAGPARAGYVTDIAVLDVGEEGRLLPDRLGLLLLLLLLLSRGGLGPRGPGNAHQDDEHGNKEPSQQH